MGEAVKKMAIDEFLEGELSRAGYGGVDITKTPLGARVTVYAMKPGLVIGRRGTNIKDLSRILEEKFGLVNPQIAVAEIEVPELDPRIMAGRVASALQRGIHFRRSGFWALNRIMEAGAMGAEISIRGKLTSRRSRHEKFRAGYMPKTGELTDRSVRIAVMNVNLKPGLLGIQVKIVPPNAYFPDVAKRLAPAAPSKEAPVEAEAQAPVAEATEPGEKAAEE